ncbi:hypothetical protein MASR2M29_01630 [Spirochaetota bacterium]
MKLGKVAGILEAEHRPVIYCANCIHCKLVHSPAGSGSYYLRVRCDAGKWQKRSGEEKLYKYCTVTKRRLPECDSYEDMGDDPDFLKDLKMTLPVADELYKFESN